MRLWGRRHGYPILTIANANSQKQAVKKRTSANAAIDAEKECSALKGSVPASRLDVLQRLCNYSHASCVPIHKVVKEKLCNTKLDSL
ncbi:MAG TPA: hypothetical protein DDW52_18335 [Planctomycetaceae bacterium]|nr:hypothetical protein [Planctomycetaceae bacterium]